MRMILLLGASNRHVKYRYFFRLCGAIRAAKLESLTICLENAYIFSHDEEVVDFMFSFAVSDISIQSPYFLSYMWFFSRSLLLVAILNFSVIFGYF
jgi:hypothetical protein